MGYIGHSVDNFETIEDRKTHTGDGTTTKFGVLYSDNNVSVFQNGIKLKETTGKIKKYIIEVKPKKQLKPPKKPKRQTKSYLYETYEYARNQAKWKAASEYCKDRLYEFKVMTEDELGVK